MSRYRPHESSTQPEPLAVDRATNTTRERASARPEVVSYHQQVRELGYKISLRSVERFFVLYGETYDETHPDNGGFLAYLMSYLDPTGETATDAVMAERIAS